MECAFIPSSQSPVTCCAVSFSIIALTHTHTHTHTDTHSNSQERDEGFFGFELLDDKASPQGRSGIVGWDYKSPAAPIANTPPDASGDTHQGERVAGLPPARKRVASAAALIFTLSQLLSLNPLF